MLRVAEVTVTESAWFAGRMKRRAANVIGRPVAFASVELDVARRPGRVDGRQYIAPKRKPKLG